MWLRRLLTDLGTPPRDPTPLLEDNRSAMKWATDSASWSRTRHMDVYYHKLREWATAKFVTIEHCPTSAQLADLCTKSLPAHTHRRLKVAVLGEYYKYFDMGNRSCTETAPAA